MTDHIGGSTEKVDLDALEKLADEVLESGTGTDIQRMADADQAFYELADPATIKALIAELKEARGLLQGFVDDEDDAVRNPLGGLSLGGLMDARDNSGCVYQSAALAERIVQTRAFLARNGKGEG